MTDLIEKTEALARECGAMILDRSRITDVDDKGTDSNLVTNMDIKVQKHITSQVLKLLPGSKVVGEEGVHALPGNSTYIWVIDPIDGTSNFVRDIRCSVISIGLVKDHEPYAGVIYNPYSDELFAAERGQGAYLNGQRIHVSDRDFSHGHLCSAMSLYRKEYAAPCFRIIEKVYAEADDLRRMGSAAYELCMLAAGRVELYFEIRLSPWDVAAAIPIILEAAGYVECLYQNALPLDRPFPVVAANKKESFEKLRRIVCAELPSIPYDERL